VKGAYAWRSLLASGARLACGSDFPVELVNPVLGLYAAVTRQDTEGNPPGGWLPQERLSALEAFRCFTVDAAYAAFEEKDEGTIAVGKRADLVVWNHSPIQDDPKKILSAQVQMTIVGGNVVYEAAK
jgi:predicted amidohydrolase YtcJ